MQRSTISGARQLARGIAVLAVGVIAAGSMSFSAAAAGKALTKKRALKLFYTKGGADARFVNLGELGAAHTQSTTPIDNFNVFSFTDVLSATVTAPAAGQLMVLANLDFEWDSDGGAFPTEVLSRMLMDGTQIGTEQEAHIEDTFFYSDSTAHSMSVPVTPGTHTLQLQAFNTSGWVYVEDRSITTLFIPS